MTNGDIRLHIKLEKVNCARYATMNKLALIKAMKNLTKFEQVAEERKIAKE